MLAISENAAEAIRGLVAAPEVPDSAGLRITALPAGRRRSSSRWPPPPPRTTSW
jgi:hypothetical protein